MAPHAKKKQNRRGLSPFPINHSKWHFTPYNLTILAHYSRLQCKSNLKEQYLLFLMKVLWMITMEIAVFSVYVIT